MTVHSLYDAAGVVSMALRLTAERAGTAWRVCRMDWDDLLPAALAVVVAVVAALALALVLALKAIFDTRELRAQLAGLSEKLLLSDHRLARLAEEMTPPAPPPPATAAPPVAPEVPATATPEPQAVPAEP